MSYPLPSTLTPSKMSSFTNCPLAFRFSYLDRLEEPASPQQMLGTLIHRALQGLFTESAPNKRTPQSAQAFLEHAWVDLVASEDIPGLELDSEQLDAFSQRARLLVEHYFNVEDPTHINAVGVELDLRSAMGDIELRGIIDRLDYLPDGEFAIVDYKTGRSPRVDQSRSRLSGVHFYAYLCETALGRRPREVRLVYMADQVVIVDSPSDQSMRAVRQRASAVWAAIERACAQEDFRPRPSALCKFCSFQPFCPVYGGNPAEATQAACR